MGSIISFIFKMVAYSTLMFGILVHLEDAGKINMCSLKKSGTEYIYKIEKSVKNFF